MKILKGKKNFVDKYYTFKFSLTILSWKTIYFEKWHLKHIISNNGNKEARTHTHIDHSITKMI